MSYKYKNNLAAKTSKDMKLLEINEKKEDIYFIETIFERIVRWTKLSYYTSWLIIGALFLFCRLLIIYITGEKNDYIEASFLTSIASILISAAVIEIIYGSKRFQNLLPIMKSIFQWDYKQTTSWYAEEVGRMFDSKKIILTGLLLSFVTPSLLWYGKWGFNFQSKTLMIYDYFFGFCMSFALGATHYPLWKISKFMLKLPNLQKYKINLFKHDSANIRYIGKLLLKIGVEAAFFIILIFIAIYFSPYDTKKAASYMIIISGLVFLWFFITQYKFHVLIRDDKISRINDISDAIYEAYDKAIKLPTSKNIKRFNELKSLRNAIAKKPEWAFNIRSFLTFLSAIALPILLKLLFIIFGLD